MNFRAKVLMFSGVIGMITFSGLAAETAAPVNLLKQSENLADGEWKEFSLNAVVTEQPSTGPDKKQNAFHVQIKKGFMGQNIRDAIPGHTYSFSIWMKSATGETQNVTLAGENNPPAKSDKFKSFQVTGEWQKFTLTFDCPKDGNFTFRFSIRDCDIYAAAPEVIDVTNVPVNLLEQSENLTAGEWKKFSLNAVVTEQPSTGPDKKQNAFHVQIKKGFMGQNIQDAIPGHTYSFSVWMKSATGETQEVTLAGENNPPAQSAKFQPFQVTGEWQKFTLTFVCPNAGNFTFRFSIRDCDIYAAAPEVIEVTNNQ